MDEQGIGFDRLALDQAIDSYKTRNVRVKEKPLWQELRSWDSNGTRKQEKVRSTNESKDLDEFATALQRVRGKKPKRNTTAL